MDYNNQVMYEVAQARQKEARDAARAASLLRTPRTAPGGMRRFFTALLAAVTCMPAVYYGLKRQKQDVKETGAVQRPLEPHAEW